MVRWRRRLAWACVVVLVLAGGVWAAQELAKVFFVDGPTYKVTISTEDGPEEFGVSGTTSYSAEDGVTSQEDAERLHAELDQLKAEGKYELVEQTTTRMGGTSLFRYRFVLADGREIVMNTGIPFDYPNSSRDVLQEEVKLLEAGEGEVVGAFDWTVDLPGDLPDQPIHSYTYRVTLSDGLVVSHCSSKAYLAGEEDALQEMRAIVNGGGGDMLTETRKDGRYYCFYAVTLADGREMVYQADKLGGYPPDESDEQEAE